MFLQTIEITLTLKTSRLGSPIYLLRWNDFKHYNPS